MAFFRQLQLLLWKNGLGIIRRPLWSVTLILWPIIIFLIIAVTRYQFPPVLKQTCYVGPRNLPSTGFFPFLETLMCNTDSSCHNTTRTAQLQNQPTRTKRSAPDTPLAKLIQGDFLPKNFTDPTDVIQSLYNVFGTPAQPRNATNASSMGDQQIANLSESASKLKAVVCTLTLPLVNQSSPDHVVSSLVTFCSNNNTVFEVAINTFNQILMELMTTNPEELAKWAEKAVMIFDQLQSETSVWETFIVLPQIFSPKSPDQLLSNLETLLINLQAFFNVVEQNFPEIQANVSEVHPFLVAGISLTQYLQNWSGKDVSIRFGDVVVDNETLWQMVGNTEIPLDQAIAILVDREMVREYICEHSNSTMMMAACATGTLDMFMSWICPEKLFQQILLAWSKSVASHDLAFVKGLLHSLGGYFEQQGYSPMDMTGSNMDAQPNCIGEELFLEVGKVVMEIVQLSPDVDGIVQQMLRVAYQTMKTASQAMDTVEGMLENAVEDASTVQMIYNALITNQTQTTIWFTQALDSASNIVLKVVASEPLTCDSLLGEFEWLFSIESIKPEVWQSIICGNSSTAEQALLKDLQPLMQDVDVLYCALQGKSDYNVTLPMILSEWHKLYNTSDQFGGFLVKLPEELGGANWINPMSQNYSLNHLTTSVQQSVFYVLVNLGQKFEQSQLWPEAKTYFFMANWILNYSAEVTAPPDCILDMNTYGIDCEGNITWPHFVEALAETIMSPSEEVLISYLQGSVQLLQHVYGNFYKQEAASFLNNAVEGGDIFSAFLANLLKQLNNFVFSLTTLPDSSFTDPNIMVPLYQKLLESTGLKPLLPVILSNHSLNISEILEVASQLGRSNQNIFNFNESDPTMAQLEQYIMQFLSMEGNLSMSIYLSMGHTLLTYSNYFSPEYVAKIREAIQPFTNQTSAGIVEAILKAIELLKTVTDDPNGDQVILSYVRQLQGFLVSLFRMQRTEQIVLPNGQPGPPQVTDLHLLSDIFNLLTPEEIMNLTQAGPEEAQKVIIQKYLQSLPSQIRPEASQFLQKFVELQSEISQCESSQDCLEGISEIFTFLDQILNMTLDINANVSINIATTETYLGIKEYEPVAHAFFSLILCPDDAAYVNTVQETLRFISLLVSQPNITTSLVQEALQQTDLTIEELNYIVAQLGAANLNDLIEKLSKLLKAQQCFEQGTSPESVAQCAVELVTSVSGFLSQFPSLQNETYILSIIPQIVNKIISDMLNTDFNSNPQKVIAEVLNATLENIKMTLQLNNLSSPEVMNQLKALENLVIFFSLNMSPDDAAYVKTVQELVQKVLQQTNLTIEELNYFVMQLGAADLNDLIDKLSKLIDSQQCFQQATSPESVAHCAMGLVTSLSGFLSQLPSLQKETYISSLIPQIVNETISNMLKANFSSNPQEIVAKALKESLENIKMTLQVNNMSTPEIMNEIKVVENLVSFILPIITMDDTCYVKIVQESLKIISYVFQQTNVTMEELNFIVTQLGAADLNDLVDKLSKLIDSQQCFQQAPSPESVAHCAMGLVTSLSGFFSQLPSLQKETYISSLIPQIVNETISNMLKANFSSNPQEIVAEALKESLENIKMTLLANNMSTPEIMNEIQVVENLVSLILPILAMDDAGYVKTVQEALKFVSYVFQQTNVTMEELNYILTQLGAADLNNLVDKLTKLTDSQQCFEQDASPESVAHCAMGLVTSLSGFLSQLPSLQKETYISSLIPQIVNQTISDMLKANFSLSPQTIVAEALKESLDNIKMTLQANNMSTPEIMNGIQVVENLVSLILPILTMDDAGYVKTVQEALKFVSYVFQQTNVTMAELNFILTQLGAADLNNLVDKLTKLTDSQQCFEQDASPELAANCVMELVNSVSGFLSHLPVLQEETSILSLIPQITNKTILEILNTNFSSNTQNVIVEALNTTLENIKMTLQLNNLSTPEIMNEIKVVENLIQLAANPEWLKFLNISTNEFLMGDADLEIILWFLQRLEYVTSNSSISDLLYPFFKISQVQVALQLGQLDMTNYISVLIHNLTQSLQYPIDENGLNKIASTTMEIFQQMLKFTVANLETQNTYAFVFNYAPPFNMSVVNATLLQINDYVKVIQQWFVQSDLVTWGNTSSISIPVNDIYNLLKSTLHLFNGNGMDYISAIKNMTKYLNEAVTIAEQPNGLQSEQFMAAILEVVQSGINLLQSETAPLPQNVPQNIQEVVKNVIWLAVHPELSYAESLKTTLHILNTLESIVQQTVPPEVAQYLLAALKVTTTYFQTVFTAYGPDNWNQLILNEMITIQSLLPPNSTEQAYISTILNITYFILEPVQGNMTLWGLFEGATEQSVPQIFVQMEKLFNIIWPLFMGGSDSTTSSMKAFADLPLVMEEVMTGEANNETWPKLQKIVEVLLTSIPAPEMQQNRTCVVELFEKAVALKVNTVKAENDLILGIQKPVTTLMTELTQSLNGSHLNMSEFSDKLQMAIENTIKGFEQTNGTLNCSEALKYWEPVRQSAGISQSTMLLWCNINLQPVVDVYIQEITLYDNLTWNCTEMGAVSVDVAAARMVSSVQSLYQAEALQTHVIDQVINGFYNQLSALLSQSLSEEVMHNLYKQLLSLQIQNSLMSINALTEQLKNEFPFLDPYTEAAEKTFVYILQNYYEIQDSSSFEKFFTETAIIFLYSFNVTSNDIYYIMSGNSSSQAWVEIATKVLQIMVDMKVFGDDPLIYQTLEQLLASNNTDVIVQKIQEMFSWFLSTEAQGFELLMEMLTKIQELLSPLFAAFMDLDNELPDILKVIDELTGNTITLIQQLLASFTGTSYMDSYNYNMLGQAISTQNSTTKTRRRREAGVMPMRSPIDDFIDLTKIDYQTIFQNLMVAPTTSEMVGTAHVFFANPDLGIVMKGATKDTGWGYDVSREKTIDTALGVASLLTLPASNMTSVDQWVNAVNNLPEGFPYSSLLKNITEAISNETPENLGLMQDTLQTVNALFQTSLTDPQFTQQLDQLEQQVCDLEQTQPVEMLVNGLSLESGQLCNGFVPGLKILAEGLGNNTSTLADKIFEMFVGEPALYNLQTNWTALITAGLGLDLSSLSALNITNAAPGVVTIGEMLRNKTEFFLDMERLGFEPSVIYLIMEAALPDNNVQILSWLLSMRHCNSTNTQNMGEGEKVIFETFCAMTFEQWYSFSLLLLHHLNTEKFIYRMVLPNEIQSLVQTMLRMVDTVITMMKEMLPAVRQLEEYLISIEDLSLAANNQFRQMSRSQRSTLSGGATFVTISRALCSNGILAIFGAARNPKVTLSPPVFTNAQQREEMIDRFKIPRNATPFCTNMYLDMVNTTGGAIAWAFLKPMLMGKILFTPDTPQTRAIMNKANNTLQEFGDLRHYSQDWIKSSSYIMQSSELLSKTLPMLQSSLGNSFVKNFIEMQTGIDVDTMKQTLNNFSNMTLLLEKNKDVLGQITTLSSLMVDLSSCITFDRYQGYDTEEELNQDAQELAKNRNLYASIIFKLPKESNSSRKRRDASNTTSSPLLPPKVRYTIRMHMDNVMRTDRVREPFFVKDTHINARATLRYNRGFIYLQENIDRAIIELQTNQRITDMAVQIQPFPYPCHHRDEYLEAISFVFPLLLMIAWVLFVADFVKKLVHEREMRLHEYMKMMGVSNLSHFFAWFLESAFYLVLTVFFLTLVLKYGHILPRSDGFLLFLYLCDYGMSILGFSFLVSTFFDKTYIAALSGSLLYVLAFFPFIVVMAMETQFSFSAKSLLSLFSPTCFSYASQYVSRYEAQGEGIQWSNSYTSPIAGDTASFGWLCWLLLIDSILYFIIGMYIRMVFPGKSGIPRPWNFPFKASFWTDLCCIRKSNRSGRGLFLFNIMQTEQPGLSDGSDKGKGKDKGKLSSKSREDFADLPVGVSLYGLTKIYGQQVAIENLNVAFYEGHVTSLLGHNGAGKTTTMSILTGLFPPSSGTVEVYGRDMQTELDEVRKELGVCMQYDVLFDHMTAKEHLLLYGQIKAPHWTKRELQEQVCSILEETGMYAHRHKRVGTLSGGMKRKLSISIAFIGGSRLVVLDEPTTGVDPCSRRSIWDMVIQHKKGRTIIMSTHHLDEAEVLSDRIAFLERGGLKCCGSPFYLKDQLGQGYKLTLTKKIHNGESPKVDNAELKAFVQAHVPEARLKEAQGSDLVYLLPPFSSNNASYRSLLTALDTNLDALQLGGYGISDTTLEEVFLHLTQGSADSVGEGPLSISETVSDTDSINSYPDSDQGSNCGDMTTSFTGTPTVSGLKLAWQQMTAILIKRFHHSRRDWKGLLSQILLPVLFVVFAMGLGTIKNDLRHYPELELSPALYNIGPSYSFFSNPDSSRLADTMLSYPGLDNACLKSDHMCPRSSSAWTSANGSNTISTCKCVKAKEVCGARDYTPPHKKIPSSQIVYNVTGINIDNYLVATADDYIRNRYGGYDFGLPLPSNLRMDVKAVPKNRTLSKVWFNPEGHHTMPAYLSGLNNFILRSNLPADKDPSQYAISVSSHPYFGRPDDEDSIVQGMLQILVAMCVLAGYSITTASFAIYEVNEHHSGSKQLQHIAGVSEPFYWAVNFFYDMVIYMMPVALTVAVIAVFQIPAFTERQNLGAVTLLLVLFGFSTFPWMYLLSSVFKDAEMAFIIYVCVNLFVSVNTIIPTSILYFMGQITQRNAESLKVIFERLSHAFLIFPQFNFGNGLLELARMNIEVQILSGYGIDAYKNPFSTDALGWMFIASFLQGVFFFGLRLLWNKFIVRKIRSLILRRKIVPDLPCEDGDEDVASEHLRVSSGAASSDVLQVTQLTKVYQHLSRKVPVVKRLSLGVPAGECFGLLGVNGAGKTTTFKMLTGDVSPTDGTAQIRDRDGRLVDIMECRNQGINIGYCPQVDALDDLLTGEEHLYFYARLHGISKREIHGVVNYLLRRLELSYYKDIVTEGYSCGTRRKLSTALALVGHPQILLLDEPSSGMDPRTKRHLWKIISDEVRGKCAVVLTSHSMEECEALCGRLAIMVEGQFRCLGSLQHIKNRFGSGFTVKMYLVKASSDAEAITRFMQSRFPSTYLKEQHSNMVEYHVPVAPGGVADIFGQLESSKEYLEIQHFSVSQTTLDEVFINFAMGKIGTDTIPIEDEDDVCSLKDVET